MLKIRMTRMGARKKPYYHIVVAESRAPRDGKFLEKLGTYDPKLPRDNVDRVKLNGERIMFWIGKGAQVSDRVAIFMGKAGIAPMPARKNNPQKAVAKTKMTERRKAKADKANAPAAAPTTAAPAPAAEAPAEEAKG
ncbi:MAG: 30S ribosomal protein S16 [Pseudomonadota bacterium]